MKLRKLLSLVLAAVMLLGCMTVTAVADDASATLDLESTATYSDKKEIEQNYTFTQTSESYTDVTKVKLDWTITDIAASYKNHKTWDPDTLTWVETKEDVSVTNEGATFDITNYSSKAVIAKAEFAVEESLKDTFTDATFTKNECTVETPVVKDTTTTYQDSDFTALKQTITAILTLNKDKFADLTATTSATKYGTYTITILSKKNVTAPAAITGRVYTGSALELVTAGTTNDGTWQYKLGDSEYSTAIPTAANAGTYTVYYKLVGGAIDNDIAESSVEVTIAKATQAITLYGNVKNELTNGVGTITINIPAGQGETMYGYSETNDASTVNNWQTGNTFTFNGENGNRYFFATYAGDENYEPTVSDGYQVEICFAAGTKITMADGTLKNIEDITEGDEVLTFNHETGKYEAQKVYIAWHGSYKTKAFTLHFDNGETLSIAGMHDLFEQEALKYVTISKANAEQFIGKHFYSCADGKYAELTSVTYETEATDFYSLYTEYNTNCIAEGFLSVPVDVEYLVNIYEFNEDLTIDHEQLENDIAEFGLYEYPANATYPEEMHEAYGWKYLYLFIGKGFGTEEYFYGLRDAFLAGEY